MSPSVVFFRARFKRRLLRSSARRNRGLHEPQANCTIGPESESARQIDAIDGTQTRQSAPGFAKCQRTAQTMPK
jgi:hypothetical protein